MSEATDLLAWIRVVHGFWDFFLVTVSVWSANEFMVILGQSVTAYSYSPSIGFYLKCIRIYLITWFSWKFTNALKTIMVNVGDFKALEVIFYISRTSKFSVRWKFSTMFRSLEFIWDTDKFNLMLIRESYFKNQFVSISSPWDKRESRRTQF